MSEDTDQEARRAQRAKRGASKVGKKRPEGSKGGDARPRSSSKVAKARKASAVKKGDPAAAAPTAAPEGERLELEGEGKEKLRLPPPRPGMSRDELARQYQPYVRSISGNIWKTLSKDIEFDDLVGYGMLGLFEAYDRFDPKYGANFMTFAYYRIRGAIYDGLRGMGWVSRTEYQKHRFEARANSYMTSVHDRALPATGSTEKKKSDDDEIGELADVVTGLVTIYVTALDAMEGFQIKDDRGPAVDEVLELLQSREIVKQAVEKLPEQEKKLIQLYYYSELSLEEVGKHLGLSKSWTSRLHTRSIDKLSRLLKDLLDEYYESTGQIPGKPKPPGKTAQPSGPPSR